MHFIENYWVLIAVAVIAFFIIMAILRSLFKLAIICVVIGGILVVFFGYSPTKILHMGQSGSKKVSQAIQGTIGPVLKNEIAGAKYQMNKNGSYVIRTKSLVIHGQKGSPIAKVTYKKHTYTINLKNEQSLINKNLDQLQKNSNAKN